MIEDVCPVTCKQLKMYKLVQLFVLVVAVAGNDLTVGPNEGNKIFEQKLEASPALFWRQVKNVTVNATDGDVISRVVITDLRPDKNGEAIVVEGGEGHKNVTIELKSPAVLRGFEFNVEVYAVPENQHAVPTEQPKSNEAPKDEHEPKVPISVAGDVSDDNLRRIRKTDEDKDVTTKVSVSSEGTTVSATPAIDVTPVPSTTQVTKENNGVKTNIPVDIGKDTEVTTKLNEPAGKDETTVIDAVAVNNQPTHLNNSDSTPKTTEKTTLPGSDGLKNPQLRNVRHSEDPTTTEGDVTISTTFGYESTTQLETSEDHEDAPVIPHFNWKPADIKPTGNQGINPPKTIGSDNAAVSPTSMAPLPYTL